VTRHSRRSFWLSDLIFKLTNDQTPLIPAGAQPGLGRLLKVLPMILQTTISHLCHGKIHPAYEGNIGDTAHFRWAVLPIFRSSCLGESA
jgi:hypothetical protein